MRYLIIFLGLFFNLLNAQDICNNTSINENINTVCSENNSFSGVISENPSPFQIKAECQDINSLRVTWYRVNITESGKFTFQIIPNSPVDYDFAVWLNPNCTNIGFADRASYDNPEDNISEVITGLNLTSTDECEDQHNNGQVKYIDVVKGDEILIAIDRYSDEAIPFSLILGGANGGGGEFGYSCINESGDYLYCVGNVNQNYSFDSNLIFQDIRQNKLNNNGDWNYKLYLNGQDALNNANNQQQVTFTSPTTEFDVYVRVTPNGSPNNIRGIYKYKVKPILIPTVTINSSNNIICNGSSVTLNANGADTYTWLPATGLNTTTGNTVIATPSQTTTYTVTGKSASGCINTAQITITVNPLPAVNAGNDVAICIGGSTTLNVSGANTYLWSPSTGLNVTTGSSIIANPSVTTTYKVIGTDNNGCQNSDEVTVTVNPLPILNNISNIMVCDEDKNNLWTIDLTTYQSSIISNPTLYDFEYFSDINLTNKITSPYNFLSLPTTIYVKVTHKTTSCFSTATLGFIRGTSVSVLSTSQSITECDNTEDFFDGKAIFDITSKNNFFTNQSGVSFSYFTDKADALINNSASKISNPQRFQNTIADNQTIYVRIEASNYCAEVVDLNLVVKPLPYSNTLPKTAFLCYGETQKLDAGTGFRSYLWSNNSTGSSIEVSQIGDYWVLLEGNNGCFYKQTVSVTNGDWPIISSINSGKDYLEINVTGSTPPYLYSIDNQRTWQTSNRFDKLSIGTYIIYVKSEPLNCLGEPKKTAIFTIPNTITPNHDGINDSWNIAHLGLFPEANVTLFDRYGKLILDQVDIKSFSWDGTYLNQPLPTGTYWYILYLNPNFYRNGWIIIKNR